MTTAMTADTVRVVIVDDHPMVLRGVSALVEATPDMHVVATAATAALALDACLEHRPDVVVMDLSLPDGDGVAITRRLRESLPDARVLVLSMCDDEDALFGALRAGAHGYVLKGAPHDCVVRALRSVAAGDTVFGAGVSGRVLQHFGANAPAPPDPLRGLSAREREVLDLLASGLGTKEIGRRLFLSPKTVRNHISNIVAKRQLADRAHAIAYARQAGLGRPPRP
jgi:DNA-binding NarL/FixJ family response regulator